LGDGGCVEVGPDAAGVSVGYEHDHRRAAGQWREGVYAFDAGARQVQIAARAGYERGLKVVALSLRAGDGGDHRARQPGQRG
jgi:hypothetical protein